MLLTSYVECPFCTENQEDDIYNLTCDTGDLEGEFPHTCDKCGEEFTVNFEYKPYVDTILTSYVECPFCKSNQEEDIYDLTCDTGDLEGKFPHTCENCGEDFTINFEYKPYLDTKQGSC